MTIEAAAAGEVVSKVSQAKPPASVALLVIALGVFLMWLGLTGGGMFKTTPMAGTIFEGVSSAGGGGGGGASGAD